MVFRTINQFSYSATTPTPSPTEESRPPQCCRSTGRKLPSSRPLRIRVPKALFFTSLLSRRPPAHNNLRQSHPRPSLLALCPARPSLPPPIHARPQGVTAP